MWVDEELSLGLGVCETVILGKLFILVSDMTKLLLFVEVTMFYFLARNTLYMLPQKAE